MKHFLFPILALVFSVGALFGQNAKPQKNAPINPEWDKVAREYTVKLTEKYKLNADQAKQMYTVQLRKQRNLASIESLKSSNPDQYRMKLESLQNGTLKSVRRLLQTKEQVELYQDTQRKLRSEKAKLRKKMMGNKAAEAEIELALANLFEE